MKYGKRITAIILTLTVLIMGMPVVFATSGDEFFIDSYNGARMHSSLISLYGDVTDGSVYTSCSVTGTSSTTSIDLLCILRQENSVGNKVIVETWTDSADDMYLFNEHEYSPAIEGREYELAVRVGIYDENGLVGYDYETYSGIK